MPAVILSTLRIIFLPATVLLLAAAWCIYWYILLENTKGEYDKALAGLSASGADLNCAQTVWGGFPFRITLDCSEPRLQVTQPGRLQISARKLTIMMQAYDRTHFIAMLEGPTGTTAGDQPYLVMTHDRITASLVLPKNEPIRFAADIPGLSLEKLGRARHILVNAITRHGGSSRLSAQATDIAILAPRPAELDELGLELSMPLNQLFDAEAANPGQLPAFRVDVDRLDARLDKLQLKGQGQLSLDAQGLPEGEILTSINDIDAFAGKIGGLAGLDEAELQAMKQLLVLLAGKSGERPIPLTIRKGVVYWGPFAVLNLAGSG